MSGLDIGTGFALFLPKGQASGQSTQMVLEAEAGEVIPPMSAVRFSGGMLHIVDMTNSAHTYTVVGFSVDGAASGNICKYVPRGNVAKTSGLAEGLTYFQDVGGGLTTTPKPSGAVFTLRIGQAVSSTQISLDLQPF